MYISLLESIIEMSTTGNAAPFLVESQKAWLYASDEVLLALNNYLKKNLENTEKAKKAGKLGQIRPLDERAEIHKLEAAIRFHIRSSLKIKSNISLRWIENENCYAAPSPDDLKTYLSQLRAERNG